MHLEEGRDRDTCTAAFNFFLNEFKEKMARAGSPREMTVAVRGFGAFVAPCRLLSSASQNSLMLSEVLQKSEQMFFDPAAGGGVAEDSRLEHLPIFVETLATMVQDSGSAMSEAFLRAIQRLCLLIIHKFPVLGPYVQHFACQAIVKTAIVVTRSCPDSSDFLSTIGV